LGFEIVIGGGSGDGGCEGQGGANGLGLPMTSSWFGGVALYFALLWCSICGICESWARWLVGGERHSIA
jgi:hypothetical protein